MESSGTRRDFWFDHLQSCHSEGITLKAYAQREGLTLSVLYGWSKRYQKAHAPKTSDFVRAIVNQPQQPGSYRLRFPDGLVLEWDMPADTRQLGQLLELLR